MFFPIADFRPDVADLNSAFTASVRNVLPTEGGYMPVPSLAAVTDALTDTPLGGIGVRSSDGTLRFFAGTAKNLYILDNTTLAWTEISKTTDGYHAATLSPWSIRAFGNFVIAVNSNDPPQVYEIGVDAAFRDLGGSPPNASIVRIWDNFVVLMGLPSNPNRVQWSALNDCESWTPGVNSSDYQDFPSGGDVMGSNEVTNPLIFMEKAIYRGTFVPGSPLIFTFDKIHDDRGAHSPSSIAARGNLAFFVDVGGIFMIDGSGAVSPIGFEKVDRFIVNSSTSVALSRMQGMVDPYYSRVYWALEADGDQTADGVYNRIIVYDWQLGRWSVLRVNTLLLTSFATPGYTMESLDDFSSSLDDLPFSLDSRFWMASAPLFAAFTDDGKLGSFSGAYMEAVMTTQEVGDTGGAMTRTRSSNPIVDCQNVFVSIGVRNLRGPSQSVTFLPEQTRSANTGRIRKNSRARYHRFRIRIPEGEDWTRCSGVDVDAEEAGFR